MSKYKVEINGYSIDDYEKLTHGQTIALLNEYQSTHNESIKEKLVLSNLKLVLSLVQKYSARVNNLDDLFQVGVIGLIKAIENFDTSLDVRFSTYAVPLILGEIKRYLRDNSPMRVPRSLRDLAY
ncbi:MAG: sigma-70 family RNA polymerase sigma factor, partial [Coprobacillus sp.]